MAASWPISVKTFSARTDLDDTVYAAHINELQDEVSALEAYLFAAPYILKSMASAAGDLPVATADDTWDVLAASGNNGDALILDSAQAKKMKWSPTTPIGSILMFGGAAAPTNFLLCDGSSLLRAGAYAALFAVIGTSFGNVDGTHFNVPDMRGFFPVGKSTDPDFNAVGATGGAKTKTIATGNLPAHDHGAAGTHTHTVADVGVATNVPNSGGVLSALVVSGGTTTQATNSGGSHTHASVGSGTALDVVNPYKVVNFIIRAV